MLSVLLCSLLSIRVLVKPESILVIHQKAVNVQTELLTFNPRQPTFLR